MIQATAPPKIKNSKLKLIPLGLAVVFAVMALVQLTGVGGFDFAGLNFETTGVVGLVIVLAAAEIFSLSFLLRLDLSPLARACSTALTLLVAPLYLLNSSLNANGSWVMPTTFALIFSVVVLVMAIISFVVLGGRQNLKLAK